VVSYKLIDPENAGSKNMVEYKRTTNEAKPELGSDNMTGVPMFNYWEDPTMKASYDKAKLNYGDALGFIYSNPEATKTIMESNTDGQVWVYSEETKDDNGDKGAWVKKKIGTGGDKTVELANAERLKNVIDDKKGLLKLAAGTVMHTPGYSYGVPTTSTADTFDWELDAVNDIKVEQGMLILTIGRRALGDSDPQEFEIKEPLAKSQLIGNIIDENYPLLRDGLEAVDPAFYIRDRSRAEELQNENSDAAKQAYMRTRDLLQRSLQEPSNPPKKTPSQNFGTIDVK
jgi:hypothetical protein